MPDLRLAYSACRTESDPEECNTFVVGPNEHRICSIPATRAPFIAGKRSEEERWAIASHIAALLNESPPQ